MVQDSKIGNNKMKTEEHGVQVPLCQTPFLAFIRTNQLTRDEKKIVLFIAVVKMPLKSTSTHEERKFQKCDFGLFQVRNGRLRKL